MFGWLYKIQGRKETSTCSTNKNITCRIQGVHFVKKKILLTQVGQMLAIFYTNAFGNRHAGTVYTFKALWSMNYCSISRGKLLKIRKSNIFLSIFHQLPWWKISSQLLKAARKKKRILFRVICDEEMTSVFWPLGFVHMGGRRFGKYTANKVYILQIWGLFDIFSPPWVRSLMKQVRLQKSRLSSRNAGKA